MRKALCLAVLCAACGSFVCARAAGPTLQWELRDINHPRMGSIKVAVPKSAITTAVQKERIVSLIYLSCEKASGKIAIELANASEADVTGGLRPRELPRLVCNVPQAGKSGLAARWEVSEIGDALARGLSSSALRRCASIDVVQNVALPKGWAQDNQRIELELFPNAREVDAVLSACAEATTAAAPAAPVAPAAPRAQVAEWKPARTISKGRTNVRVAPGLDSRVVGELAPGAKVLVQSTSTEWWKVKPRKGEAFGGYIRQDRFVLD